MNRVGEPRGVSTIAPPPRRSPAAQHPILIAATSKTDRTARTSARRRSGPRQVDRPDATCVLRRHCVIAAAA